MTTYLPHLAISSNSRDLFLSQFQYDLAGTLDSITISILVIKKEMAPVDSLVH